VNVPAPDVASLKLPFFYQCREKFLEIEKFEGAIGCFGYKAEWIGMSMHEEKVGEFGLDEMGMRGGDERVAAEEGKGLGSRKFLSGAVRRENIEATESGIEGDGEGTTRRGEGKQATGSEKRDIPAKGKSLRHGGSHSQTGIGTGTRA
jgi:hypothetical protein